MRASGTTYRPRAGAYQYLRSVDDSQLLSRRNQGVRFGRQGIDIIDHDRGFLRADRGCEEGECRKDGETHLAGRGELVWLMEVVFLTLVGGFKSFLGNGSHLKLFLYFLSLLGLSSEFCMHAAAICGKIQLLRTGT